MAPVLCFTFMPQIGSGAGLWGYLTGIRASGVNWDLSDRACWQEIAKNEASISQRTRAVVSLGCGLN